eukprot:361581-Chlamydomonas_euryale.AAC.2
MDVWTDGYVGWAGQWLNGCMGVRMGCGEGFLHVRQLTGAATTQQRHSHMEDAPQGRVSADVAISLRFPPSPGALPLAPPLVALGNGGGGRRRSTRSAPRRGGRAADRRQGTSTQLSTALRCSHCMQQEMRIGCAMPTWGQPILA